MKWLDMLFGRKPDEHVQQAAELQARSDKALDRAEQILLRKGRLDSYRRVRLSR